MTRAFHPLMDRSFGDWLRSFCDREDLTIVTLEKKAGIPHSTLYTWLNGESSPKLDDVHRLANAFRPSGDHNDSYYDLIADILLFTAGYRTNRSTEEIEKDIRSHFPPEIVGSTSEQPPDLLSPFQTLNHYLIRSRSPKASDFTEGLIYYPEKYLSDMKILLEEKRRALLVGHSTAGKTALAIILAKQLQEAEHYKVFYLDISGEQVIDGRALYQAISTSDRKGNLYILDNCHLTPDEISEFCAYWEERPLKRAQCILISRSRAKGLDALSLDESEDYFDLWDDVNIEVQPEELFHGILEKYVSVYQQQEPDRYIALEEDDENALREQHAHNLVISRIRLEVWREIGGRLSELTQEMVYKSLSERYLRKMKSKDTLRALCILWQYEVPAHNQFVKSLPTYEVESLEREKLLTHTVVPGYGTLYQLTLHPVEAQEIFKADRYQREGDVKLNLVEAEIVQGLRAYLLTEPPNYNFVYYRLYRQQQINLLHRLLKEHDLQICAQNRFESGEIFEATSYLYSLSKVDSSRAQELLQTLIGSSAGLKIELQLLKGTFFHMGQALWCIQKINMQIAQKIVAEIDMKQLAQHAQKENFPLYWLFLVALNKISPAQAKYFLKISSPAMLVSLVQGVMPSSVNNIIKTLQELEFVSIQEIVEAIDMKRLAQRVQTQSLQQLYWFLHALRAVSQTMVDRFLKVMTPENVASLCILKEARIDEIMGLLKVMPKNPRRQFLQFFSHHEIAEIFERSSLPRLGSFFQYYYQYTKPDYALFREQFLALKLATASIEDIGKFIKRIKQVPEEGTALASDVLRLLEAKNLSRKISNTDLEPVAILLYVALTIDKSLARQLLKSLSQPDILHAALEKSRLRGIQLLIRNIADIDTQYLQIVQWGLENSNLVDKLAVADVEDIGHFLWNIYTFIDNDLAQAYCKLVDAQDRSNLLNSISLESLCRFLWNLTHISNLPKLQTLDNPAVVKSLQAAWEESIGLGMNLLGILAITSPNIARDLQLPSIETQKEQLGTWLIQLSGEQPPHPHTLALTLHGLRSYGELEAQAIVHTSLDFSKAALLLEDAITAPTVTPRSLALLQEIHEWLRKLPVNPN